MTLALIVAIVFVFVLLIQKSNNAQLKEQNRKNTETNVSLQKEIMLKWDDTISKEIDEMPPIEDYYSFFKTLYNKYQMPFFQYGLTQIEEDKENVKIKSLLTKAGDFIRVIEYESKITLSNSQKMKLILHNDCDFLVSLEHCDEFGSEYNLLPYRKIPSNPEFFKDIIDMYYSNMTSNKNLSLEEQNKYPRRYFFQSDIISRYYFNFIILLRNNILKLSQDLNIYNYCHKFDDELLATIFQLLWLIF